MTEGLSDITQEGLLGVSWKGLLGFTWEELLEGPAGHLPPHTTPSEAGVDWRLSLIKLWHCTAASQAVDGPDMRDGLIATSKAAGIALQHDAFFSDLTQDYACAQDGH